ncbi:hypothetical protein AB0E62_04650 [Streptomyces sp. NPDC038707]|uniref:hypothetical protein n=1 Tax=unclassified Streptomyces TaxID=2593676 RepID=UPI0033D87B50
MVTGVRNGATVTVTAAPDADPVALAGEAVRRLLGTAGLAPAGVPLLVLACADPADWPDSAHSALLDGEFAADVVRRVLLANGLVAAVPLGVSLDPHRVEHLAAESAAAITAAEGLDRSVAVATFVRDGRRIATATELHPATGTGAERRRDGE